MTARPLSLCLGRRGRESQVRTRGRIKTLSAHWKVRHPSGTIDGIDSDRVGLSGYAGGRRTTAGGVCAGAHLEVVMVFYFWILRSRSVAGCMGSSGPMVGAGA